MMTACDSNEFYSTAYDGNVKGKSSYVFCPYCGHKLEKRTIEDTKAESHPKTHIVGLIVYTTNETTYKTKSRVITYCPCCGTTID